MKTWVALIIGLLPYFHFSCGADLNLTASPEQIIPGIDPALVIHCDPGSAEGTFRQIFFLQLEKEVNGTLVPLATVAPGKAPSLEVSDPRMTVSGVLDNNPPATASLDITVNNPLERDAGRLQCQAAGLGNNGREVTYSKTVSVTVHPQSQQVDAFLKAVVFDLKKEADRLVQQAQVLQQENQRLAGEAAARRTALNQKKAHLQELRSQVSALEQAVTAKETELVDVNNELVETIRNISADAPQQRVAFNAVERTERNYASGAQILFETVELNEGKAYNVSTSMFRPPVDGVYFFTSGQLAHDTSSAAYRAYTIRKNGTIVGGAYNSDDRQGSTFQQSSMSTVAAVTQYDQIGVYQQYASDGTTNLVPYHNTPQGLATNFAGYLVY